MKRLLPLLIFMISISAMAQNRGDRHKRIKTLKVAFITERLDLSSEEAQKFWPIYNKYSKGLDSIRHIKVNVKRNLDKGEKIETISEEISKKTVLGLVKVDAKAASLKEQLVADLSKIITYNKILDLLKSEEDFRHKMLEQYRKRKGDWKKNHP